jgi:predicted permease
MRVLGDLLQDLRYGARMLRRSPGFAVTVVLTLALGIGACAAIFTLVDAVLLRRLPVQDPGRLVLFSDGNHHGRYVGLPVDDPGRLQLFSYRLYQQLSAAEPDAELVAEDSNAEVSIVLRGTSGDEPDERAAGRCVTANFFRVLGVPAQVGRVFEADDETSPGANAVVVLSDGYWRRRFSADPSIVGTRLGINGASYLVVGVTRPGFTGAETGSATDFWVPVTMVEQFSQFGLALHRPDYWWLQVLGRLGPAGSLTVAQARANQALRRYLDANVIVADGPTRARTHLVLQPAPAGISPVRETYRQPLLVLMTAVGLLLVIVGLNVSHLLLARAVSRQPEMSVRAALGASRARLLRQLLAEGLWLAVLGAAGGLLLDRWLQDALIARVSAGPSELPLALDLGTDARVFFFVGALVLGLVLLLGLVPALHAFRMDLQQGVRVHGASLGSGPHRRLTRVLLASQVAFSLVLLVGAGLLAETLDRLRRVTSGFDDEHVLLAELNVWKAGLSDEAASRLYRELERRVGALPGVRAVGLADSPALGEEPAIWAVIVPGSAGRSRMAHFFVITPRDFEALGMQLVRGRGFRDGDVPGAPPVVVLNQTMATRFFDGDAVGRRLLLGSKDSHEVEVIGVVADTRTTGPRDRILPTYYLPVAQAHYFPISIRLGSLAVRAMGDPERLITDVRREVHAIHAGLPMLNARTLRVQMDRTLTTERLLAALASGFGVTALFLVAIGLHGVISQWAARRARELGVRVALGATAGAVRWLVLRQALLLVGAGALVGIPVAIAAARLLGGVLYGVRPVHAPTLTAATAAVFVVGAVAAYLPARRASRIDPMSALRCE